MKGNSSAAKAVCVKNVLLVKVLIPVIESLNVDGLLRFVWHAKVAAKTITSQLRLYSHHLSWLAPAPPKQMGQKAKHTSDISQAHQWNKLFVSNYYACQLQQCDYGMIWRFKTSFKLRKEIRHLVPLISLGIWSWIMNRDSTATKELLWTSECFEKAVHLTPLCDFMSNWFKPQVLLGFDICNQLAWDVTLFTWAGDKDCAQLDPNILLDDSTMRIFIRFVVGVWDHTLFLVTRRNNLWVIVTPTCENCPNT